MATKREITKKYAREYAAASKKTRGRMLDELVATTGWSRANARRQVSAAGYPFSEEPQGVQEQWLAENHPDAWAQGVRAVTTDTWTVRSPDAARGAGGRLCAP